MGDGPDGVPHVQGDVDTEEKEDNHNKASSNILNSSNISKRRRIEKINHNLTEDDLPAGQELPKSDVEAKKWNIVFMKNATS